MLVLSRRPGESIIVTTPNGETIRVKVNRVKGEAVSLAFDARLEVGIYREEVAERKGVKS